MLTGTNIHRRNFIKLAAAGSLLAFAPTSFAPTSFAQAQSVSGLFDDLPMKDDIMGDANAPVTIIEYASMTCPHCRSFHENILPVIKTKYIDTGKVKLILRPFPFDGDKRGLAAFLLAKCAPNDNYYAMVDALFSTQSTWANPKVNPVPELQRMSKLAGMTDESFKACLSRQDLIDNLIATRDKAVKDFGVTSTPTLFINDQKFSGDLTVEGFEKAIAAAL